MTVVCNTSPITNLAAIAQLDLLYQLYGEILIPQAGYDELTALQNPVPGTVEDAKVVLDPGTESGESVAGCRISSNG